MNWHRIIAFVAGFLLAIQGAAAQTAGPDRPDPTTPQKVSGMVTYPSFASQVKDAREAAAAIAATALELQDKNKKLEAENGRLKKSMVTSASTDAVFRWKDRGTDPCKLNHRCTIEFTLAHSRLNPELQKLILEKVKTTSPNHTTIKKGETLDFMAFGRRPGTERVVFNVLADWDDPKYEEPALSWEVVYQGQVKEFLSPFVCSNYSLRTRPVQNEVVPMGEFKREPIATIVIPPVAPAPDVMPLAGVPLVVCI